jgi:hypothetical protein
LPSASFPDGQAESWRRIAAQKLFTKFFPGICLILPANSSSNKAAKISEDDNWFFPGARRFRRGAWTHRLSEGPKIRSS